MRSVGEIFEGRCEVDRPDEVGIDTLDRADVVDVGEAGRRFDLVDEIRRR